jgi:phosphoglycolate phosphatase-like HAD superfamily hydrolase
VISSLRGVSNVFGEVIDRIDLDKYSVQEGRKLESWEAKARALGDVTQRFGVTPDRLIYVGDTQPDYKATVAAKTGFIWAAYGWQNPGQREGVISARSVEELSSLLLKR